MNSARNWWGGWCAVHHGPPEYFEDRDTTCDNCKKKGCSLDVFDSRQGRLCGNCLEKVNDDLEYREFKKQFRMLQARSAIAKITIVFVEGLILLMIILMLASPAWRSGIIQSSIAFFLILLGILAVTLVSFVLAIAKLHSANPKPAVKK